MNKTCKGDIIMNNTNYTELLDAWDDMLYNARDVADAEDEFNQELFCDLMHRTWQAFRDGIDFDAPEDDYSLHIMLVKILMEISSYSGLYQVLVGEGVNIELSVFLVRLLRDAILDKKLFPRDEPILKGRYDNHGEIYHLSFDMESGILTVSDSRNDPPQMRFDPNKNKFVPIPQPSFEPFEVTDLSKFWFDDEE